jgi:hypothetical protein
MQRACDSCGETYEAQRKASRFCSPRCRQRAQRGQVINLPDPETEPATDGPLRSATLDELSAAGRQGTALGVAALLMATRLDSASDSAAGIAALTKQWQATLNAAMAGATKRADLLDELKGRRDRRRGA